MKAAEIEVFSQFDEAQFILFAFSSKNSDLERPSEISRLVFLPKLDILYCGITKCGCSAWSDILTGLEKNQVPEVTASGGGGICKYPYKN